MFERRIQVLLVEDSPSDALLVRAGLTSGGASQFEVTHVECLADALHHVSNGACDVVLLDLGLPESHGLETLASLRARTARVPIVVLTGHADEELATRALQEGAQDYLVKGQVGNALLARTIRYAIERKRNEEALRQSEERYRLIVENQTEFIVKWRPDGTRTFVNPSYCRYFGQREEECLGTSLFLSLTPPLREALSAKIARLTPANPVATDERRSPAWHGDLRWQAWTDRGIFDAEGRLIEILSTGRDITKRKRAEEALRESEEQLRHLADNMPAGFTYQLLRGADGKAGFRYCSRGVETILGVKPSEVMSDPMLLFRMIHEDDFQRVWNLNEAVFRDVKPFDCELRQRTRSGEVRWLHCRSVPRMVPGGGHVWDGLALDITQRKQAEEARERLLAILEGTTDFVGMCDAQKRALYVNRAGRRLCGIGETEDITGLPVDSIHPEWARARIFEEGFPAAIRDGAWSGETALLRRDRQEIPVSQVILAHKSPAGNVEYFSTIIRDLSDYKRLQEQFLHAQKMQAVGRLAGGVAHDFNNLLTVIRGYGESLLASVDPDSPDVVPLREIVRAATTATALTRQLLAFGRRDVSQPVILDLNESLTSVNKMLRRLIPENIVVKTVLDSNLRSVLADPAQIQQVIMNLAINARDAMPTGGTLVIETANVDVKEGGRDPGGPSPGAYSTLTVTDTGCGMDRQTQALIFEPFFTTKPRGQGSGLGLATVFGVVKQSGGFIRVLSEPGCGSTFTIYLPSLVREARSVETGQPLAQVRGSGEVILIAEEEAKVRVLVRTILQKAGYMVLEARPGAEALQRAAQHDGPIHLLIADPGQGGVALARELLSRRPELKVIFASANRVENMDGWSGEVTVVQKPYEADVLLRTVRSVLDRQLQIR
jgi:PAS domain S-box-containing protein